MIPFWKRSGKGQKHPVGMEIKLDLGHLKAVCPKSKLHIPEMMSGIITTGLNATSKGLLEADDYGRTSRPGVFASGDVVNGARTVVEAVAYSKRVAEAMHAYIQNNL